MLTGIDISHYNPDIDYAKARAAGALFIVAKATQGTGYVDPTYLRRRAAIKASGAVPGRYHFLEDRDPVGQVHHHLDVCGSPAGELVQLDWEPPDKSTPAASVLTARAFHDEWRAETSGHPLLIYYPHWVWEDQGRPSLGDLIQEPLWASHYLSGGDVTFSDVTRIPPEWWGGYAGWSRAKFFQFAGENGRVLDIGGIDLDIFDGSLSELEALAKGFQMDWGQLGTPPNLNGYQQANVNTGLADIIAMMCYGVSGFGDATQRDGTGLFMVNVLRQLVSDMAELRATLAAGGSGPSTLTDADYQRIAAAVVDEQAKRLEG